MKKSLKYGIAFLSLSILVRLACIAQQVHVSANIDSNSIRIGDQVKLHLIATYNGQKAGNKIQWPVIPDSLSSKIKVVSKSKIDTIKADSLHPSLQEQKQDILITCFDSGYYAIPPFKFIINGDTSHPEETEPIMLYVRTVAVDTTKSIKDIKGPLSAPFTLFDQLLKLLSEGKWIGITVLSFFIVTLIIAIIMVMNEKNKQKPVVIKAPPVEPHIKALTALEELSAKKLWQEGKIKDYHSALTDILRTYLDDRFGINAQEMITDEIVYAMRRIDIDAELKNKLKQVLVLADLVKFAKEQPLPTEHEASFANVVGFVNSTVAKKEATQEAPSATTPSPAQP